MLEAGKTVPTFLIRTTDGTAFTHADLRGRKTLLVFTREHALLSEIERQIEKFSAVGVGVAAVTSEKGRSAAEWANAEGLSFPVLVDEDRKIARQFGVFRRFFERPAWFVISENGEVLVSERRATLPRVEEVFQRVVDLVAARARR